MQHLEKKWLEKLAKGDTKAYETIFKAYYKPIYGTALRMTKDPNTAKDACQEVFLELWKNREKVSHIQSLKSYLHRGTINRSLNILKSKKRHAGQDLDGIVEPVTPLANPQQVVEHQELELKIKNGIDSLPERCRQVFVLSRHEGKSYKEIAALLSISTKTVENQISKALKILRTIVKNYRLEN